MNMNVVIVWHKGVGVLTAHIRAFSINVEPEHQQNAIVYFFGVDTSAMQTPPPALVQATLTQVEDMSSIPSYTQFQDFVKALG